MATLTQEQTDFLKSHHIPMDKTFDASGLSSKEYKAKMKENAKVNITQDVFLKMMRAKD